VQKVSAVFAAGASVGHSTGTVSSTSLTYSERGGFGVSRAVGPADLYEERYTGVASLLVPPIEPTYENPWGVVSGLWVGFWTLVLIALIPAALVVLRSQAPGSQSPGVPLWLGLIINVAFLGALVVPVVRWKQREAGKRRGAYAVEHPRWRSLRKRWEDSYYCHKDGIVFVPEQAGSMTAPEFAASTARAS
jgi:hypothetical protein